MSRIVIVAHAAYPTDPRIRRQAEALVRAGNRVDILCLRGAGQPPEEEGDGLRIIRLPVDRAFTGLAGHLAEYLAFAGIAALRLAREHRRRRYQLVQVATVPDFLVFAAAPLKLSGIPLLLDLHEDMPEFFRDRFATPALRPLLPLVAGMARASAAVADELITVHEPLRLLAIRRGVPPDKISVVMNSADPRLFDPSRYADRPFMDDGELRVIHHSNLQRIYGQVVLIEAVARIGDELRLRVDVYGDGPYRSELEAAIGRTGTADRVHLNGPVPMEELPGLIAGSDVGVVPTLAEPYLQFSLSTKLLEYAAMGITTVASDLATMRAHFTPDAIRYVPAGDPDALAGALRELAADPVAAARLGAEAHRQAADYRWDVQAARYLEIVKRLAAR
jgi:glycosyltransferase involved in cell wall biosynthesis